MTSPVWHTPLVSCIMPTSNRRRFVPQAIRYFLRQEYARKELILVDDGTDAVADLIPADSRIRYYRTSSVLSVGEKRNLACSLASGDIIVHWDDDDWMADWRVHYQVQQLVQHQADLCGLNCLYFFDPFAARGWEYCYPGTARPWVYGATLCYTRQFWQAHPFRPFDVGEDTRFVWSDPAAHVVALEENRWIAALIHEGNTGSKKTSDPGWKECPLGIISSMLSDDWRFYAAALAVGG